MPGAPTVVFRTMIVGVSGVFVTEQLSDIPGVATKVTALSVELSSRSVSPTHTRPLWVQFAGTVSVIVYCCPGTS